MRRHVDARCPLRPQDRCSLCFPGANGPQDCGLVYLVRDDDDLRADWEARMAARDAEGAEERTAGEGFRPDAEPR